MIKINNKKFNKEIILEIGKFAILWNIFESNKCNNDCSSSKLEKLASSYKTSKNWDNFAFKLQERAELNGFDFDGYVDMGLSQGRGLNDADKNRVKGFINSNGTSNLDGGIIAIFRIRNNMFHGLKDWRDLHNQIDLFKTINAVLEEII